MLQYDPDRLLVSLHIPKTAGTSLRTALTTWFGAGLRLHYPAWAPELQPIVDERRTCVHGHFTPLNQTSVAEVLPHATQAITVMRDPFARLVSEWRFHNYSKQLGTHIPELADDPDFDTWFGRRRDEALRDPITRVLKQLPYPPSPDRADRIFDHGFVAVGTTERFSETLVLFAACLDTPRVAEPWENMAAVSGTAEFNRYRREHERACTLEYEAYGAAEAKLDAALNARGGHSRPAPPRRAEHTSWEPTP